MRIIISIFTILILQYSSSLLALNNEIAIGMATPSPSGVSIKYWLSNERAVDMFGKWEINNEKAELHFDVLTHDYKKFEFNDINTPFYHGYGVRLEYDKDKVDEELTLGVRIPLGFSYFTESAPLDIFVEAAPRVDVIPKTNFGVDFMLGLRYRILP